MKKISLLLIVLVIASCSKKHNTPTPGNNPQPNPNNPTNNYWSHFIPNWYDNDTLIGYVLDSALNEQGIFYDTIFTKSHNDTSYIVHKGRQFYIWTEQWLPNDTFKMNKDTYGNIIINNRLDTIGAVSNAVLSGAVPYRYKDKMNNWAYNHQLIILSDQDPKYDRFKAHQGHYQGQTQKY